MAELPTPLQKRDILYGVRKSSPEGLKALSEQFISEGWLSDALDFSAFADAKDLLTRIKVSSIEEGNTFLYLKACRLLGEIDPSQSEVLKCAQTAEAQKKWRYAIMAYEKMGNIEKVTEIKNQHIAQDGDIVAENLSKVFIPSHSEELEGSELESEDEE